MLGSARDSTSISVKICLKFWKTSARSYSAYDSISCIYSETSGSHSRGKVGFYLISPTYRLPYFMCHSCGSFTSIM